MMSKTDRSKEKIEELKQLLNDLINSKGDLLDSDILEISRLLDEHLVEYHKLLEEKKNN
jgi:hypothetical protein